MISPNKLLYRIFCIDSTDWILVVLNCLLFINRVLIRSSSASLASVSGIVLHCPCSRTSVSPCAPARRVPQSYCFVPGCSEKTLFLHSSMLTVIKSWGQRENTQGSQTVTAILGCLSVLTLESESAFLSSSIYQKAQFMIIKSEVN